MLRNRAVLLFALGWIKGTISSEQLEVVFK